MKYFDKQAIKDLERVFRLNLINSISGYKAANLVGTKGTDGENLAIISSVVHLGSNPALLGFIMRPASVERHTLENIKATGFYTINSVQEKIVKNAHYTSAKFNKTISEFETCNLEAEYLKGFWAPYVGESQIKIGMKLEEIINVEINGTYLVVGSVDHLFVNHAMLAENGQLDLTKSKIVSISGLNNYHQVKKLTTFPYARVEELPDFKS